VTTVLLGHPLLTVIQGLMLLASSPYCGFSQSIVVIVAMMSELGPSPLFDLNVDQCQAILAKLSNRVPVKQVSDDCAHYHYRFRVFGPSLHIDDVSSLQLVRHYPCYLKSNDYGTFLRRQHIVMSMAASVESHSQSVFPGRDPKRLMEDSDGTDLALQINRFKSFLREKESDGTDAKPFADNSHVC
jgi:hypothetical protein